MKVKLEPYTELNINLSSSGSSVNAQFTQPMSSRLKYQKRPEYKISVVNNEGLLQTFSPLTLRSIVRSGDIQDIAEIGNVSVLNLQEGSILQYSTETNKYEVRLGRFDGGEF